MTMILDLPRDLVMEIFHRVPLKSVREVRLTCKTLNRLSQSESFAKMHLAKEVASREEGEHQRVVILDDTLSLMSLVVDRDPSTEPKVKLIGLNKQVKISHVSHCEGLLLCVFEDDRRIVVWNPYWGQTRWIEPRYIEPLSEIYVYSLGYANKRNTCRRRHKLLRFVDFHVCVRNERFQLYEIYDFDSDQWTTLDDSQGWHISSYYQRGVSLQGNTYFCATKTNSGNEPDCHLICFDYKRESFGPLMPMPFSSDGHDHVTLSCVKEEKLAVLQNSNPYNLDIWITTKIRPRKVSWSKFLTLYTGITKSIYKSSGFFIDEGNKIAMGFVRYGCRDGYINYLSFLGEAGYFKSLQLVEKSYTTNLQVCSYVPSLVKLKQPTRGPNKQQSDWEQHRYDQKMSRLVQVLRSDEYVGAVKRKKTYTTSGYNA